MMKKIKNNEVGVGYVMAACRNVGLKSNTAYYKARKNQKEGIPLSFSQKAVLKEYKRLTTEE